MQTMINTNQVSTGRVIADLAVFITNDGKELLTDSRAVAIAFGKQHKNVLRDIERMRRSEHPEIANHGRLNFEPVEYTDAKGERRPMYRMTADGLSELAMSFTGDLSRVTRIRFLAAFRAVEQRLLNAEKTILQMLHDHDRRSAVSESKARIGSMLMHSRRKEKPALVDEEARLKELTQPSLPVLSDDSETKH
jgi:Rha family phage regulatory protein